jgi:hypothetical protein
MCYYSKMKLIVCNIIVVLLLPTILFAQEIDIQLLKQVNVAIIKKNKAFLEEFNLITNTPPFGNVIIVKIIWKDFKDTKDTSGNGNYNFNEIQETNQVGNYNLIFGGNAVIFFYCPESFMEPILLISEKEKITYKFQIVHIKWDEPLVKTALLKKNKNSLKLIKIE